ncbi:type 4b pilus protein PilO2 [Pseudomonas sp. PSPC3-3]|uniref:type 4b pilus protein PilO2 n=1 Tax=unclassified Pseudomonas TaxID=196821 RepID=UPI003CF6022B
MAISAPPTKQPKVQILTYHGNSFVTGLLWHPLDSLTGYMREARQFGRNQKMDIVAIRPTKSIIQAGFVAHNDGAVKGMYSLAASLAGQLGDSWIAAWQVTPNEDRYALVAVDQGAVLPGCDQVGSAEDTTRKVAQMLGSSISFKDVYLPKEFGRGGESLDVAALLQSQNLSRDFRLRPLTFGLSKSEWVRLSVVALLVVVAFIGWRQWEGYKDRQALAAAIQRQAELDALNARANEQQTMQALGHPWAKQPAVADFIEACNGAIDRIPVSIAGWVFASAQCDGEIVSVTINRTGNSTASGLIEATRGHFADEPAFFKGVNGGNSAALKIRLSTGLAGDEPLLYANEALPLLTSWLHGQGLEPQLSEIPVAVPIPATLPGGAAPPPMPLPEWKQFGLTYTSLLSPAIVLRNVPDTGFRLREIKVDLKSDQLIWSVTGDLYAK